MDIRISDLLLAGEVIVLMAAVAASYLLGLRDGRRQSYHRGYDDGWVAGSHTRIQMEYNHAKAKEKWNQ